MNLILSSKLLACQQTNYRPCRAWSAHSFHVGCATDANWSPSLATYIMLPMQWGLAEPSYIACLTFCAASARGIIRFASTGRFHLDLLCYHQFLSQWNRVTFWLFPGLLPEADVAVPLEAAGSQGYGVYWFLYGFYRRISTGWNSQLQDECAVLL